MRRAFTTARAAGLLLAALLTTSDAAASSLWFIAWGSEDWDMTGQWLNARPPGQGPPSDFATPTYVTTFDVWKNVSSVIDAPARTGTLYVGGWKPEYDAFAGRAPSGEIGVLRLRSDLTTGDEEYIRIGFRDSVGIVEHTAGRLGAAGGAGKGWGMYLGTASAEAEGYYDLSGTGVFARRHLKVGSNGLGIFDMSGGEVEADGCGCASYVGEGYEGDDVAEGRIPGIGLWDQSDGTAVRSKLVLGDAAGSVGVVRLHGDEPTLTTRDYFQIGRRGVGTLVLAGGTVSSWSFVLGAEEGSFGMLSIIGGSLEQKKSSTTGQPYGIYVGRSGAGQLVIVGAEASVTAEGNYQQNGRSVVEFQLVPSPTSGAPEITPIEVRGRAIFQKGARLRVTLSQKLAKTLSSSAHACEPLPLITYGSATGLYDIAIETPSPDWEVYRGASALTLVYHPAGYC